MTPERIAELRALCEADAYELEGECLRCRSAMHIPEDLEPTVVCDLCAQEIVATALPEVLDEIERLTAALAKAEHERNLATVEAIGHAHSDGHLSSLVDEQREEIERLTKERDNWRRSADAAMNSLRYWEGIKERAEKAEAAIDEANRLRTLAIEHNERVAADLRAQEERADRLSQELDRHIDALASLGHLPDDAEHVRWCKPCRGVREGSAEPPPCRECASMVVGGRCLSCGAEHKEEPYPGRGGKP
jgi:hypothetical protein